VHRPGAGIEELSQRPGDHQRSGDHRCGRDPSRLGFLSENAEFARICAKCGITFIGPSPEAMRAWGDKVTARGNAERYGLPLLPGSGVLEDAQPVEFGEPLVIIE